MATYTDNLALKKPSSEDFYNIQDFNDNADILDTNVAKTLEAAKKTLTNLLRPTLATTTVNGVTITNNGGDGTYTLNGTATAGIGTTSYIKEFSLKAGTYKYLGCPSGGSTSTYRQAIYNASTATLIATDMGDGDVFTTTTDMVVRIYPVIEKGTVCSNLVFRPMLTTDLDATYDDFVPYTGDTGSLNGDVAQVRGAIGDAWNSTTTYTVGQYCIYGNKLWKCLVGNSNVTPTEGSYWTETSIATELKAIWAAIA